MERAEFEQLSGDIRRFAGRYGPLFGGWAAQDRGEQYLRGLLVGGAERRNAENLAEQLVDARLYLPERWTDDRARCRAAGVPDEVPFQTKPALALVMLAAARARGQLRARWVTGDEVYGGSPAFRDALAGAGYWYVLEVP